MARVAVVLFNLGGPDRLESVQPFLANLFSDPAIVEAPALIRRILGPWLARRRAPTAREIYASIGGSSPLLALTQEQARALEQRVGGDDETRAFVAMRYWHPLTEEAAAEVRQFDPDEIVLLPLYPQFSTTTTGSSLTAWRKAAARAGISAPTYAVCCYPTESGFVQAQAQLIRKAAAASEAEQAGQWRVLFSAHGLPEKTVAAGDPYPWQVQRSAQAVAETVGGLARDWVVCYQSRVGPLKWIGPSLDDELARAGGDGVPVLVTPISFVSEHSETLVELDMEYREDAEGLGVPEYVRVPTVGTTEPFIDGLARLVGLARQQGLDVMAGLGHRQCPMDGTGRRCPIGDG